MSEDVFRIATWNVHGLRGGVDAVAEVVRAEGVDVLLLQESGPRRRLRALGQLLGSIVCADPLVFPRRRVQNAVLLPSSRARSVRSRLVRFAGGSVIDPRGVLLTEFDERWTAASAHLGLRGAERGRHVAQLTGLLEGFPDGFVLGGDLNALPGEPGPSRIAGLATDVWDAAGEGPGATYPAAAPTARIDYLYAGPAVRPIRAWTAGGAVSDHLMVVAEVALER